MTIALTQHSSIIGPAIGGALAQPCESYPDLFPKGTIFDQFPFLLPNLVCTVVLVCGVTIGILFLEETHEELKHRHDYGLELGKMLVRRITRMNRDSRIEVPLDKAGDACFEENASLIEDDDPPPGYRTSEGSPHCPSSRTHSPVKHERSRKARAAKKAFTKQVVMNIVGYGILALYVFRKKAAWWRIFPHIVTDWRSHTISFDQLMPVFLSSPVTHDTPTLPFKFTGGFGLSTKTIGTLLSIQGVYSMVAQLLFFPFIVKRFGTLRLFRLVVITWPFLYFLVPYTVLLPPSLQIAGVMFCLLWRITAQVLAFPANAILLTNSAPSSMVLGIVNGVAASTASLSRALGPTSSGLIHSAGLSMGYTGFAWWIGGLIAAIGAFESLLIREGKGRMDTDEDELEGLEVELPRSDSGLLDPASIDAALEAARQSDPPTNRAPRASCHLESNDSA